MEPALIIKWIAKAERHLADLRLRQLLGGAGASPSDSSELEHTDDVQGDIRKLEILLLGYRRALSDTARGTR